VSSAAPSVRVAAFDVDGTLTRQDCVVPFARRVARTHVLAGRLLRNPGGLARAGVRRDRDALKAAGAAAAFRGAAVDDVRELAEAFARDVHATGLRPEIVALLEEHRGRGDTVLLVSASFEMYVRPLGELVGAHDVLAARLEVGPDGRLTGRLEGLNCRGPEKVRRLHAWLDEHAGGRAAVHVTAYGDSGGDAELLADADEAHWVGARGVPRR
jgi:phosphatidylglycerophosphatase C